MEDLRMAPNDLPIGVISSIPATLDVINTALGVAIILKIPQTGKLAIGFPEQEYIGTFDEREDDGMGGTTMVDGPAPYASVINEALEYGPTLVDRIEQISEKYSLLFAMHVTQVVS